MTEQDPLEIRALAGFERLEDRAGVAECHELLGNIARGQGRPADAERHYTKVLALRQEAHDDAGMAGTLALFGFLHNERGDYEAACERYEAALALFERIDDREQVASLTNNLGNLCLRRGERSRTWAQGVEWRRGELARPSEHAGSDERDRSAGHGRRPAVLDLGGNEGPLPRVSGDDQGRGS